MKLGLLYAMLPLALVAGCGGDASDTGDRPAVDVQAVGVSGNRMTLDGVPWLSRGVALQAVVRPVAALQASGKPNAIAANINYGVTELAAITAFGADTLRFQVSQPSLDPASPLYDSSYLAQVTSAVQLARSNGFVAMIMMQDESISGETTPHPLPIAQTQLAWDVLNARFGTDRGVVYELYNEPQLANNAANWQVWKNGGLIANQTTTSVGMQALISHLRDGGAANVFAVDGLEFAHTLDGMPPLVDPLNRLVYAVHPYPDGSADESHWDADFGIPSQTLPVWADEWSAATGQAIGLGALPDDHVAVDLLNYIRLHGIPLCRRCVRHSSLHGAGSPGMELHELRKFLAFEQDPERGRTRTPRFSREIRSRADRCRRPAPLSRHRPMPCLELARVARAFDSQPEVVVDHPKRMVAEAPFEVDVLGERVFGDPGMAR